MLRRYAVTLKDRPKGGPEYRRFTYMGAWRTAQRLVNCTGSGWEIWVHDA